MRTTLDIDDDVLSAAKEIARREGASAGQIVSRLLRQAFTGAEPGRGAATSEPEAFYGFRPFAPRGVIVTDELVDRLRDEDGI